ncbi:hypothetical protein GCM10009078_06140 [Cupriavidus gilardii]
MTPAAITAQTAAIAAARRARPRGHAGGGIVCVAGEVAVESNISMRGKDAGDVRQRPAIRQSRAPARQSA